MHYGAWRAKCAYEVIVTMQQEQPRRYWLRREYMFTREWK